MQVKNSKKVHSTVRIYQQYVPFIPLEASLEGVHVNHTVNFGTTVNPNFLDLRSKLVSRIGLIFLFLYPASFIVQHRAPRNSRNLITFYFMSDVREIPF